MEKGCSLLGNARKLNALPIKTKQIPRDLRPDFGRPGTSCARRALPAGSRAGLQTQARFPPVFVCGYAGNSVVSQQMLLT